MYGITFNGKHSYNDFGLYIMDKTISPPSKKKILDTVPYMNSNYDFSTLGSNGELTYDTRKIVVKLGLISDTREQLYVLYSQILSWLMDVGQSQLIFDFMPDYYFLAEVYEAPDFDDFINTGELTVTFVAEPFKYKDVDSGDKIWDLFNFETDYLEDNAIFVTGSDSITIHNVGRATVPFVTSDAAMSLVLNGYTMNVLAGINTDPKFILLNGENNVDITGTGNIAFAFREELL